MAEDFRELDLMTADAAAGSEVFRPAPFWVRLNAVHRQQLESSGFDNFKRTVNAKYFQWGALGIVRHQLSVVVDWLRHPDRETLRATLLRPGSSLGSRPAFIDGPAAWLYKTFVAMYADLLRRQDPLKLMERLEEPLAGNPVAIVHRGRRVSQDLCNSVHEFYSAFGADGGRAGAGDRLEVAELGAGYGRLAFAILSAAPGVSYTIIDIPPALYISQRYLTAVFPDVPTFRYRRWTAYDDVRVEFERARLRFLLPDQAELLPPQSVDMFLNVSSLHEMSRAQVERYFALIDRLCRGRVYTKQWRRSRAGVNGVVFGEHDYPVPARWRTVFHRHHPIQSMFFDALYDTR
jgi:putative sugar O-methyltransferase